MAICIKKLNVILIISISSSVLAEDIVTFSIDPASPTNVTPVTPDDILIATATGPPTVDWAGISVGLQDNFSGGIFDNLNALSYGLDSIHLPAYFSVDRTAAGAPGSGVAAEAQPSVASAAGDVFQSNPSAGNAIHLLEHQLGLTAGFFGDDLNALDLDKPESPDFAYFSLDALSTSIGSEVGAVSSLASSDILLGRSGGTTEAFARANRIGVQIDDDLDALLLSDAGNRGQLDPGLDVALFSISSLSPSATTRGGPWSPGALLFTDFLNPVRVWKSAAEIGLRSDDELDALDTRASDVMYTCAEIDALVLAIAGGSTDLQFDLNYDGIVNTGDLDRWLVLGGQANLASGNAYLHGDANLDGDVDVSDFNIWNSHKFQSSEGWCAGDFNANGVIDVSDFNIWNENKFTTALDAASAVPEPTLATQLIAYFLWLAAGPRTRTRKGAGSGRLGGCQDHRVQTKPVRSIMP